MRASAASLPIAVLLLSPALGVAEEVAFDQVTPPTAVHVKTIPATSFVPANAFTAANMGVSATGSGTVCNAAEAPCTFTSGIELPSGARVLGIDVEACDNTYMGYVDVRVNKCPLGANCGGVLQYSTYPGCVTAMGVTPFTVQNAAEYYPIIVKVVDASASIAFRAVRIRYDLQVSDPPPVSSFDDVPDDHPQRAAIEALVGAGISAGCDIENFCPDNPVTRGQLAVFMAKALGLHWAD